MLTCGFSFGTASPNRKSILVANSRSGKGERRRVGFQRVMALREARVRGLFEPKLLHSLIKHLGDIGDKGRAVFLVADSPHENHQHEWPRGVNNTRIVMDLCDFARLMGDARAFGKPGR